MPVFTLRFFESTPNALRRVALLEIDGKAPYFDFVTKMKKSGKKKEIDRINTIITELMVGDELPPNTIKEIKGRPSNDDWKEFELRHKRLRVYFFLVPPDGNIVVMGEYKKDEKTQRKTVKSFQELKQLFKKSFLNDLVKFEEE